MARLRRRRRDEVAGGAAETPPSSALRDDAPGASAPDDALVAGASVWRHLFGNDRPVEIEIGPGRGDVLLAFATARPDVNFFAIEHVRGAAEHVHARLRAAAVHNARVLDADAACVIAHLIPPASVAAFHIYFPDPWPKRRHRKRRLVTPAFAAALARTLVPGGAVHVATDVGALYDDVAGVLHAAGFTRRDDAAPARPTTRFEKKYAGAGTFAGTFSPAP
jgi:tRNA (guanine-N7-)-methyltransferase